jgi:hypothetical protein
VRKTVRSLRENYEEHRGPFTLQEESIENPTLRKLTYANGSSSKKRRHCELQEAVKKPHLKMKRTGRPSARKGPKRVPEELTLRGMLERDLRVRDQTIEDIEDIEHQLDKLVETRAREEEAFDQMEARRRRQREQEAFNASNSGQEQEAGQPRRNRVKATCRRAGLLMPLEEPREEARLLVKGGEESGQEENPASILNSEARPPALEEQMEAGAQGQPDLPNNHPEWGKFQVLEPILDCASAQLGRWSKVETMKRLLVENGLDQMLVELGVTWLFDTGVVSGDGFSQEKILKPTPGIRINSGHKVTSKTLFLTFFPEYDDDVELLKEWVTAKSEYSVAGIEECPKTGKTHLHVVCDFQDPYMYRWLKHIFPTVNIDCDVRHKARAIKYVQKVQLLWEDRKETSWVHAPEKKLDNKARAAEILRLADEGDVNTIKREFPAEYLRSHATIHKLVAEAALKKFQE